MNVKLSKKLLDTLEKNVSISEGGELPGCVEARLEHKGGKPCACVELLDEQGVLLATIEDERFLAKMAAAIKRQDKTEISRLISDAASQFCRSMVFLYDSAKGRTQ